jgi:hypothetical protein
MDNPFRIRNGLEFTPQSTPPANGVDGDIYYDTVLGLQQWVSGAWGPIGGGGGGQGGINFVTLNSSWSPSNIDNSTADNSIGDWIAYANPPGPTPTDMVSVVGSTVVLANQSVINTNMGFSTNVYRLGQTFDPAFNGPVTSVTAQLHYGFGSGATGNLVAEIYSDSAGVPGSLLATSSNFDVSVLTGSFVTYTFTFSSCPTLNNGTTYHLIFDPSGITFSGSVIEMGAAVSDPYPGGVSEISGDSGATWTPDPTVDMTFEIFSTGVGVTNVTITRTTTVGQVLDGSGSFLITKDAANRQGQGVSVTGFIPLGYRDQTANISFAYKVISGSISPGDLQVFAYDVTNSTLLIPTNNDVTGTGGIAQMTVFIPLTCAEIRVGFHFASVSATAVTLSFDDFIVSIAGGVGMIPALTDPVDFTSTWYDTSGAGPLTKGTATVDKASYRRVGRYALIKIALETTTAGSGTVVGDLLLRMPAGLVIDTTVGAIVLNASSGVSYPGNIFGQVGHGYGYLQNTPHQLIPIPYDVNNLRIGFNLPTPDFFLQDSDWSSYSNLSLNLDIIVPIVGWTALTIPPGAITVSAGANISVGVVGTNYTITSSVPSSVPRWEKYNIDYTQFLSGTLIDLQDSEITIDVLPAKTVLGPTFMVVNTPFSGGGISSASLSDMGPTGNIVYGNLFISTPMPKIAIGSTAQTVLVNIVGTTNFDLVLTVDTLISDLTAGNFDLYVLRSTLP